MLLTLFSFAVVIGVLIFVHELGHFIAAKALGVQVIRFSVGIGPAIRALTFRRGETEYCLSWLPLGGYVSMATLEEQGTTQAIEGGAASVPIDPARVFERRPAWARAIILLAGVTMNIVFAFVTFSIMSGTIGATRTPTTQVDTVWTSELPAGAVALSSLRRGDRITAVNGAAPATWEDVQERLFTLPPPIRVDVDGHPEPLVLTVPMEEAARTALVGAIDPNLRPVVGAVVPGSPAEHAGFRPGDRIIAVNGDSVASWLRFTRVVRGSDGKPITIVVARDTGTVSLMATPDRQQVVDPHTGKAAPGGFLGVSLQEAHQRFGPGAALREGGRRTLAVAGQVLGALKGLVMGQVSVRELGGPIRIGQVSGEAARQGPLALIMLMAVLSVNLAILNLLPIPVLDGGGLVLVLAEAIRRRPLSRELRVRLTNAGLIVVAALMLFAISNDVFGLFRR